MKSQSYAIAEIQGIQYKFTEKQYLYVSYIPEKPGKKIFLSQIFLFLNNKGILYIGSPILNNIKIQIEVLKHLKGKKIIIFKKKRRKGYKKKNGFRSLISKIQIISFYEKEKKIKEKKI